MFRTYQPAFHLVKTKISTTPPKKMIFRPKKNVFSLLADFHRSAKSSKKLFCARLAGRTCSYRLAWGFNLCTVHILRMHSPQNCLCNHFLQTAGRQPAHLRVKNHSPRTAHRLGMRAIYCACITPSKMFAAYMIYNYTPVCVGTKFVSDMASSKTAI